VSQLDDHVVSDLPDFTYISLQDLLAVDARPFAAALERTVRNPQQDTQEQAGLVNQVTTDTAQLATRP
jgi:hypothetical protein